MQEVFEKIIEKLEEYKYLYLVERDSEQLQHCKDVGDCGMRDCTLCVFDKAIEIVKQAAEQYTSTEHINCSSDSSTNGWIPCSERLPSDCAIHEVTAQFSNGKAYTEFAYYDETKEEWWKHDEDGLVNVIAWKEPSDPYQPKGE